MPNNFLQKSPRTIRNLQNKSYQYGNSFFISNSIIFAYLSLHIFWIKWTPILTSWYHWKAYDLNYKSYFKQFSQIHFKMFSKNQGTHKGRITLQISRNLWTSANSYSTSFKPIQEHSSYIPELMNIFKPFLWTFINFFLHSTSNNTYLTHLFMENSKKHHQNAIQSLLSIIRLTYTNPRNS